MQCQQNTPIQMWQSQFMQAINSIKQKKGEPSIINFMIQKQHKKRIKLCKYLNK